MRKTSNEQPKLTYKAAREEQIKPKVSRRKEIITVRAEIEMKKTIEKANELKADFLKRDKIDKHLAIKKRRRGLKAMQLATKKKSQWTLQKYKGS